MNRAQRRAKAKSTPAYRRGMTREDRIKALIKNGITPDDVQKAYEQGYAEGRDLACEYSVKTCYAAAALAMHELEGWGHKRITRFLRLLDSIITDRLSSEEIIEEVMEKCGFQINFSEVMPDDKIVEVVK